MVSTGFSAFFFAFVPYNIYYSRTILPDQSMVAAVLAGTYFFSNWVDGLNPDPTVYVENRANDWNVWLNFGYIYYLQ